MEKGNGDVMARDIEDGGFTRIHNDILEALARAHLSSLELRITFYIIRKTYGFHKKTDVISLSQFEECNASKPAIIGAIQNLVRLGVISRIAHGQSYEYGFNKYFENWLPEVFETRRPSREANLNKSTSKADDTSKAHDTSKADDTSKAHDTSKADDTSASKADDTKTSKADDTHKRKKETIKEISPHQIIFGMLAKLCRVDPALKRGQIARTAKALTAGKYTPGDLEMFEVWWKTNDFRGQRGEPPTLAQVLDKILQAKQESQPTAADGRKYEEVWDGGQLYLREVKH